MTYALSGSAPIPGFWDARGDYEWFVRHSTEKELIAALLAEELAKIRVRPGEAITLFDAGAGSGLLIEAAMREAHRLSFDIRSQFHNAAIVATAKEISFDDAWRTLQRTPARFHEHPDTVFVLTNLPYAAALQLSLSADSKLPKPEWRHVALQGSSLMDFKNQIKGPDLKRFLVKYWRTTEAGSKPIVPLQPAVLVIYRDDRASALKNIIPQEGQPPKKNKFIIASQTHQVRPQGKNDVKFALQFKAELIRKLSGSLAPGARLVGIHAYGNPATYGQDPAEKIGKKLWPDFVPFLHDDDQFVSALKEIVLPRRDLSVEPNTARLGYHLQNLTTNEVGVVTQEGLEGALRAIAYALQIPQELRRRRPITGDDLEIVRSVLRENNDGKLPLYNSVYTVARAGLG